MTAYLRYRPASKGWVAFTVVLLAILIGGGLLWFTYQRTVFLGDGKFIVLPQEFRLVRASAKVAFSFAYLNVRDVGAPTVTFYEQNAFELIGADSRPTCTEDDVRMLGLPAHIASKQCWVKRIEAPPTLPPDTSYTSIGVSVGCGKILVVRGKESALGTVAPIFSKVLSTCGVH